MTMMPWLQNPNAPKQPGLGQQFAQSAASKVAADQVAKLGLKAAGTAAAGPLGGVAGEVAGELAGPLASQAIGALFNKGGPVYMQQGGFPWAQQLFRAHQTQPGGGFSPDSWRSFVANLRRAAELENQKIPAGQTPAAVPEDLKAKAKEAPVEIPQPTYVAPRSKASAQWNIPLGEALGADWSTSGHYADMDTGEDPWGAMIKGTWKFNKGGEVPEEGEKKSIWNQIADKVSGDFDKRKSLFGEGKKPVYKAIGGMTKGPLGMEDMKLLGKGKDVSKVKIKKNDGTNTEEVELSYHAPLADKPKPTGE